MKSSLQRLFPLLFTSALVVACSDSNTNIEDASEDQAASPESVQYRATLTVDWTTNDFPTNYPIGEHFSPIIGASHNEQVIFWEADGQPASRGIELMAEFGAVYGLADEVEAAQENGYSQAFILGEGLHSGQEAVSVEFVASNTYPLITLVSMLAPSPDWFVGVAGLSLQDEGEWIEQLSIDLPLYDAGTDIGLQFSSPNEDSAEDSLPITLLSSDRIDTDFDEGVHFETGQYIATLSFERIDQSE